MEGSNRALLIWSIELLLIAVLVWLLVERGVRSEAARPLQNFLVPSEIEELTLERPDWTLIFVNKVPRPSVDRNTESISPGELANWEILGGGRPNADALNSLLSQLKNLELIEITQQDLDSKGMATVGLDNPVLTIKIKTINGVREVKIGGLNKFFNQRYLSIGEVPGVWLASSQLSEIAVVARSRFVVGATEEDRSANPHFGEMME